MAAGFKTCVDGLIAQLEDIRAGSADSAQVGLFVSDHTPDVNDDFATYDAIKASWSGYGAQNIDGWSPAAIDGSDRAVMYSDPITYTVTSVSGVTVYGYYVFKSGVLQWAERVVTPITPVTGIPINIIIRYRLQNL